MEYTDPKTYRSEQVLAAKAIWAVFHEGKPINLKSQSSIGGGPGPKYKKVSFSNKGHALNLAIKLNKMFNTNKFQVHELSHGKIVK